MKQNEVYISRFSAWAPGVENVKEWEEWAQDKREIIIDSKSPDLSFTEPMFRRRLSQISKMTVQVVHDLLPVAEDTKIIFLSFRGELSYQFKLNKMFIEDNEIKPAAFSLSVFNAPAALASMAFSLKGGYSAVYPGENSFVMGLTLAEAAFICKLEPRPHGLDESEELIFVYADEDIPNEYKDIYSGTHNPLAFGFVLTRNPSGQAVSTIPFSALKEGINTPEDFLKRLILSKLS
ncbi:MAG: beta-ketoacyl synthase chain length factor [Treponema sp.]|nr:beta-ketoacyl synthase chain length factor [Treponema sp.]